MPVLPQPHKGPWANLLLRRMHDWDCTQRDLALVLDVGETRVSDWVHERHEPSDEMKARIVERLKPQAHEVAPEWMLPLMSTQAPPAPDVLARRRGRSALA